MGCEDCTVTWEKAEDIPRTIINEYCQGVKRYAEEDIKSGPGHQMHTLSLSPSKNQHTKRPIIKDNSG